MRGVLAMLAAVALIAAACGTPGSLPEPPACAAPAPAFVPGAGVTAADYATAVDQALLELQVFDQHFRSEWPERRFRERDSFKSDFVVFAGTTRCLVDDLLGADVPPEVQPIGDDLSTFLTGLGASLDEGEDAVATRNASAYDDWIDDWDRRVLGYTDFQERLRTFRVDQ